MPLIDQFNRLIRRLRPTSQQNTTSAELERTRPKRQPTLQLKMSLNHDRHSIIEDSRQMYADDTRPEGMIRALAADATKGGYTLSIEDGPTSDEAMQVAADLESRLGLFSRLDDWTRLTLRDGDTFNELSVIASGDIVEVTRKPTLNMYRNSDKADRFEEPEQAYFYSEEPFYLGRIPPDAIFFADWQMIHARWNHDEGSRYGRPLFAAARKAYRRIDDGEMNVAIRRKVRSGRRYQHRIEGGVQEVEEYIAQNQDTLNEPFAALQDFFGNADIKVIEGDDKVGDIDDILHHIDTFAFGSPVPLALIGYGKSLNRDILEQKLEQYERALEGLARWVGDQLVKPLLEVQWLLKGIYPPNLEYEINWATKKTIDAETLLTVAKAGVTMRGLGWPDEYIIQILAPLIPGLNAEGLLEAMQQAQARQPDEIDRIAQAAEETTGEEEE